MNGSKFNVLLYMDDSQFACYAVIYSAILMINMPNMHLTVVNLKECNDSSIDPEKSWLKTLSINPTLDGMQDILDIYTIRAIDVRHCNLYCNSNVPDAVDALLGYARKQSIDLIVIGSGNPRTVKGLIFGNLAITLQSKSPIPVLLVKNLPDDYRDSFKPKPTVKIIRK